MMLLGSEVMYAGCLGLVNGPVVIDVDSCKSVDPKSDFDPNADYSFYKGMTAVDRKNFMNSYGGLLLRGHVVKSLAVREGLSKESGALYNEKISLFIPPSSSLTCQSSLKKRIAVQVKEICCSGGANAPCLLKTSYTSTETKIVGTAKSSIGDKSRVASKKSEDYKKAIRFYKKKSYKKAVIFFEKARVKKELDVTGSYLLGVSYRKLDLCRKTVPILQDIFERSEKKDIWADEEKTVRRSNFLLARCYAKTNKPSKAVIILNSYLIEPKKYRKEIRLSLKHKDFGWINASKEYRDYSSSAGKYVK